MQIDAATVMALVGMLVAIATAIIAGLSRYATNARDTELNRRLGALEAAQIDRTERMHQAELATARLQGDVNLVSASHKGFEADLTEIKDKMVTRDEWKSGMDGLDKRFDDLVNTLRGGAPRPAGRYSSTGSDPLVPAVKR